ncbi:hypothetical protein [Corallibacter sp.]|uniref:hypothetical protein n=1 Tax=Corallibacter sp. TaxID=2038084 RepID=UPI003AB3A0BE
MTELKIEWDVFRIEVKSLIKKGEEVNSLPVRFREEEKFIEEYNNWRVSVIEFLKESINDNGNYSQEFKNAHRNGYRIPNQKSAPIDVRQLKQNLKNDLLYLKFNLKIFNVCDLITNPDEVDLEVRRNYSTEEILDFLLDKLYDLYDNYHYPILEILNGNGIELKRIREDFELVKKLESYGYVHSNNIGNRSDAQLTLEGKIYVERKRKSVLSNYDLISDNKDYIDSKFDEVFKRLEKLDLKNNVGQQIIFEEIEDSKELYTKLNKKDWGQLLKGKVTDLILDKVLTYDMGKMIFETITNIHF